VANILSFLRSSDIVLRNDNFTIEENKSVLGVLSEVKSVPEIDLSGAVKDIIEECHDS